MLIGSIVMFAGRTAPAGWIICDGSAVSRTDFSALFDVVGTQYGEGDGSTTFNLPDISGRLIIGSSSSHPVASVGGEETHVLTSQEMAEHTHVVGQHGHANGITATTPALTHKITQAVFKYNARSGARGGSSSGTYKACTGASSVGATRSTSVAVDNHPASDCSVNGSITDCDAFDTSVSGQGMAHSNMQPYITLNYIIYAGE